MSHWQTILAVDSDKWACATYAANFPGVDVRCSTVAEQIESLPYADVITAGPPCPSFSVAGKGLGEHDPRNGWPDFVRAVAKVKPRMFLAENVPGMLIDAHRPYLGRVITALESLGYQIADRLLDAVNFGVPQFRKRLFLWGIRNDIARVSRYSGGIGHRFPQATHVWPPPDECMFGAAPLPAVTVGQALGIDGSIRRNRGHMAERGGDVVRRHHPASEPSPTITDSSGGGDGVLRVVGGGSNPHFVGDERTDRDITDEPSTTIAASGDNHGNALPQVHEYRWSDAMLEKHPPASPASPAPTVTAHFAKGGPIGLLNVSGAEHGVAITHEPSPTIKAGGNHDANGKQGGGCPPLLSVDGTMESSPSPTITSGGSETGGADPIRHREKMVRRLTPLECARLQSVPDDFKWPKGISKTNQYRIIGNGVACGMANALSEAFASVDPHSRTVIDLFCGGGLGAVGWHRRFWSLTMAGEVE